MAALFVLVSAMMAVAAEPIEPQNWIVESDYPLEALSRRERGDVLFRLTISPDGKTERCDVVSSGSPRLDAATCAALMQRSHFRPALDDAGRPVMGTYRSIMAWRLESAERPRIPTFTDLEVDVDALPPKLGNPVVVGVIVVVDATGRIESCGPIRQPERSALTATACQQVTSLIKPTPTIDAGGAPARSVQAFSVTFRASGTAR